jgi:HEPN domain-containing protein
VTNRSLARSYLKKAGDRLDVLDLLHRKAAWSDVVREAQEIVELALKGILRHAGVEPPKWHDVGEILIEHAEKLPDTARAAVDRLADISRWLRKERELAFYGDVDFIPTEEYDEEDAKRAIADARFAVEVAQASIS